MSPYVRPSVASGNGLMIRAGTRGPSEVAVLARTAGSVLGSTLKALRDLQNLAARMEPDQEWPDGLGAFGARASKLLKVAKTDSVSASMLLTGASIKRHLGPDVARLHDMPTRSPRLRRTGALRPDERTLGLTARRNGRARQQQALARPWGNSNSRTFACSEGRPNAHAKRTTVAARSSGFHRRRLAISLVRRRNRQGAKGGSPCQ